MPTRTTIGQLLVNEALPEEYRDYDRVMDNKSVQKIMQSVADKDPDRWLLFWFRLSKDSCSLQAHSLRIRRQDQQDSRNSGS